MKLFIAGLCIGIVAGIFAGIKAWDSYQWQWVTVPVIDSKARLSALDAISKSQSIIIEEAENYDIDGKPSDIIKSIKANSNTKSDLINLFSQNEEIKLTRWQSRFRSIVACFIPHHRLQCIDSKGSPIDIYICFECNNFSVGSRTGYHQMTKNYRQRLADIFASEGFHIAKRKSEQDAAANP
jgi:hypothetical protein